MASLCQKRCPCVVVMRTCMQCRQAGAAVLWECIACVLRQSALCRHQGAGMGQHAWAGQPVSLPAGPEHPLCRITGLRNQFKVHFCCVTSRHEHGQGPDGPMLMCSMLAQAKGARGRQRRHRQGGLSGSGSSCQCLLWTVVCLHASQGPETLMLKVCACGCATTPGASNWCLSLEEAGKASLWSASANYPSANYPYALGPEMTSNDGD